MNTFRQAMTVLLACAAGSLLISCSANSTADQAATSEPSATTAATSRSSDSLLPEGTYRTPDLTVDELVATGVAAGFDQSAVEDFVREDQGVDHTEVFTLKLEAGHWTLFEAYDGGPAEIGWAGTYQVIDADTVVAGDDCEITYDYALHADELTIDMVEDPCFPGEEGEQMAQTVIYGTAPFAKID